MSYDIHLYRKETREKYPDSKDDYFSELSENLVPFSPEQKQKLNEWLSKSHYFISDEKPKVTVFGHKEQPSIRAYLFDGSLNFSASGDGIAEILLTSSELTHTGEFVKYDPQFDEWEIW